jgi:hypothetical protein
MVASGTCENHEQFPLDFPRSSSPSPSGFLGLHCFGPASMHLYGVIVVTVADNTVLNVAYNARIA